jgi:acyl carrier protein
MIRRDDIRELMDAILRRQGKPPAGELDATLRAIGFRSLDFSELALRVEKRLGRELNFDASTLRAVATVSDVLDFFEEACRRA